MIIDNGDLKQMKLFDTADKIVAKPFLKWAGGKTQLIDEIESVLPRILKEESFTYIEPFVGSGAVMFWMLANYSTIKEVVINDINSDLINTYKTIQQSPIQLIDILEQYEQEYHNLEQGSDERKEYYYAKRKLYNKRCEDNHTQAGLFIFLNRTCFNGLYRVNRKNEFNVPIGSYKTPLICDKENLLNVSKVLEGVTILSRDYSETIKYAEGLSFFYLDPPYKPLSKTSSFNSYAKTEFDDQEQYRLKSFCDILDRQGHHWLLSNSDVKNIEPDNDFFDDLYGNYSVERVKATRRINANSSGRGQLNELLINNF